MWGFKRIIVGKDTVTIPRKDFERMISLIRQANGYLRMTKPFIDKIEKGLKESKELDGKEDK